MNRPPESTINGPGVRAKAIAGDPRSGLRKYRDLFYGDMPWPRAALAEVLVGCLGQMHGAAGLWLRAKLYPLFLGRAGRGAVFGRGVALRHPHKIRVGEDVIVEDGCVLDAKGAGNAGITLGDRVFLGRCCVLNCKGGSIEIERDANLSSDCNLVASERLVIGEGTMVGAGTYAANGGAYDYNSPVPFAMQNAVTARGALTIGRNCWIGANVTILDGACLGEHCVVGAGAVVTQPLPPHSVAVGVPARVVRTLAAAPPATTP